MKIAELSETPLKLRREFWTKLPATQALEWVEPSGEGGVLAQVKQLETQVEAFFIDPHFSDLLLKEYPRISTDALKIGRMDSLFKDKGKWWPFLILRQSLQSMMAERDPQMDTHSIGYIIGTNSLAHVAFDALSQFGFGRIKIVEIEEGDAQSLLSFINSKFFGVDIQVLKSSDLTHEPNNGSVMINCVSIETARQILEELSFLNFMKKPALVIDTNVTPPTHLLMDEARHVGMKTIAGYELQGMTDWLWLKKLMPELSISKEDYMSQWQEFVLQSAN